MKNSATIFATQISTTSTKSGLGAIVARTRSHLVLRMQSILATITHIRSLFLSVSLMATSGTGFEIAHGDSQL